MKFGYLRRDDDGHYYLIPEDYVAEFDERWEEVQEADEDDWDIETQFIDDWGDYRVDGDYADYKVVMPE